MKGFAGVGLLSMLMAVGIWWGWGAMTADSGRFLPVAFGPVRGDMIEIHMAVNMGMVKVDPPLRDDGGLVMREDGSTYVQPQVEHWDEWLANHFEVRTASGESVPVKRASMNHLFKGRGLELVDFTVCARVEKGSTCTFVYTPIKSEPKHYCREFTVPEEETKVKRYQFPPAT